MAKSKIEKIASIEEEIRQLKERQRLLQQQHNAQERKDRTKRLRRRMGLFESLLPDTIPLTDEQFKTFLAKTVNTEQSRRILDELTAQNAATAATQGSTTANSAVAAPSSASSAWHFHHCLTMDHPTLSAFLMMLVSSVLMASDFMMPTKTAANPVAATSTTAYSAVAAPSSGSAVSVRIRASNRHIALSARSRMAYSRCPALPIRPGKPSTLIGVTLFMAFLSFEQPRPDGRVHPVLRTITLAGAFFQGCGRRM